jgi:aminomethyltransferase
LPSFNDLEYRALTEAAGWLDLSDRSRLCLLGADREKFLHGQVTNDVLRLRTGQGAYAALVNAKGRLESDLFVYKLADELLLDLPPGLGAKVTARLEKHIIAEDVQIVDVSAAYALLSVHGPRAPEILAAAGLESAPADLLSFAIVKMPAGDLCLARSDRFGALGYDLFVPQEHREEMAGRLDAAGARRVSWEVTEVLRIENAIPRFGADMDESNLAPETGIQSRAISYAKGCYIGQEVIARIRTYGQVAKALRLLKLDSAAPPAPGTKLLHGGKEVGWVTSCAFSPKHGAAVALGYVRKEVNAPGSKLGLAGGEPAEIVLAL